MLKLLRIPYLILLLFGSTILVGNFSCAFAAATSRAYKSTQPIANGSMVSLDTTQSASVVVTTPDNVAKLVGVVVPDNTATVQFNTAGAEVQVAQSGGTPVLVTDLNGTIQAGDHVTISPLAGVGMKATDAGMSIGIAQSDFKLAGSAAKTITDKSGRSKTVHVAQIKIMLGISQFTGTKSASLIPSQVQSMADALSGEATSAWRIIAAAAIILVTLIVIGAVIYSSIRNSLVAIGRNPLSSPAIYRSLFQLLVITMGIFFIALLGVYLILTR